MRLILQPSDVTSRPLTDSEFDLLMGIGEAMGATMEEFAREIYLRCAGIAEQLGEHRTAAAIRALVDNDMA